MKSTLFKRSVFAVTALLASSSSNLFAANEDYAKVQKELKIMSKIFETSLAEQTQSDIKIYGSKKAQSTYLAKQGMVFSFQFGKNSFSSSADWEHFGEGIGNFVGAIASEVGNAFSEFPEPPEPPEFHIERELSEKFEAYNERMEALEQLREKNQAQREEVRELQREIRHLERKREEQNGNKNKIDEVKSKLESKMESLNTQLQEYKNSMEKYRELRDKKYTESTQLKTKVIFNTLCDYGATLRTVNNNEYVTVIFNNYSQDGDKVFVFDAENIKNCDSREKLLKSAIIYNL